MTYSIDFRKKVLEIKLAKKMSSEEAGKFFKLSKTTIQNWKKNPIPKECRNKPATKVNMELLAEDVIKYRDSYQYERAERMGVSTRAIGYALMRLNVTYKKKPKSSKSQRRRETYIYEQDRRV